MWYILATCSLATFWQHASLIRGADTLRKAWGQKNTRAKNISRPCDDLAHGERQLRGAVLHARVQQPEVQLVQRHEFTNA
ncbi:hypothetical protein PF008_g30322, partial [Phytophthora fragariae]